MYIKDIIISSFISSIFASIIIISFFYYKDCEKYKLEAVKQEKYRKNILYEISNTKTINIQDKKTKDKIFDHNKEMSNIKFKILTSTTSSSTDLIKFKFCNRNTTSAHISYTPVSDEYTLTCIGASAAATNPSEIKKVRGILTDDTDCPASSHTCKYKVNR